MVSSIDLTTYPTARSDADEDKVGELFSSLISKGVIHGVGNALQVYADSTGMHVKVKTGRGTSGGFWGNNDIEETLDIDAAHPTANRIDSIVLRLDRTSPATLALQVEPGDPSLSPVAPTLETDDVHLADITVGAAVSTIASNKVADARIFAQPGPSNGLNQTQFRGDLAAPAFISSAGSVMGLIGLRSDVTTHSDDIALYTYGGDFELLPGGTRSVVFPAASSDVSISVRQGDIDMISGLLRFDPSVCTSGATDGGGAVVPTHANKFLKVLIGGGEYKIPLFLS